MLNGFSCFWLFATPWTVAHQAPLSMEILQAKILEWVAISCFRGSSQPRNWTPPLLCLLLWQAVSLPLSLYHSLPLKLRYLVLGTKCLLDFSGIFFSPTCWFFNMQLQRRWWIFVFILLKLGSSDRSKRYHCCVLSPQGCIPWSCELCHWCFKSQGAHMEKGKLEKYLPFSLDMIFS